MHRRAPAGLVALTALLLLAGCTSFAGGRRAADPPAHVSTAAPGAPVTVVADADPVASAVDTSRALFRSAPVVVVVRAGDVDGTLLGASAAVGLGVPLLVQPAGGGVADALARELDRLGTHAVLAVGRANGTVVSSATDDDTARVTREVTAVPAEAAAVAAATGLHLRPAAPVPPGTEAAAIAALDPAQPAALSRTGAPASSSGSAAAPSTSGPTSGSTSGSDEPGRVPRVDRGKPLSGVVVLATGSPESLAGIATARAAGARVQLTGGATDPRSSPGVIQAVSQDPKAPVVALGAGFAAQQGLDWQLATARTGVQLPGGGQLLFPGRMLVALYGTPGTAALGVLGEQDLPASIQRARQHAAAYQPLVDKPIVPAFEIIATIASSSAGPDGNYSSETDPAKLRPWVDAARDAGLYVILDLQPGRSDFLTQAKEYQSLLEQPNVGLALDSEWRLGPGELPLQQIGSAGIDEINGVVSWLADLTRAHALPQKLLVLHQFRLSMIQDRDRLDTSRSELAVMIHADGQGTQGNKQATWRALHEDLPPGPLAWGWKNFYDEDHPMLTPEQTVAEVHPTPDLISYQ